MTEKEALNDFAECLRSTADRLEEANEEERRQIVEALKKDERIMKLIERRVDHATNNQCDRSKRNV